MALFLAIAAGHAEAKDVAATALPSAHLVSPELSDADAQALLRRAKPMPMPRLARMPAEATAPILPFVDDGAPLPEAISGERGLREKASGNGVQAPPGGEPVRPEDHGRTSASTIYHYTDNLVDTELNNDYPYRAVGWFVFTSHTGGTFRCTAQLISRSILVTAGHCVHGGGGGAARWIRSGYFIPGYANGGALRATATTVYTTAGWFSVGALDRGYDVGVVVLAKPAGSTTEIGATTGFLSFCPSNCLQRYWYLTQLGYPGNYYGGAFLTESEHVTASNSRDYMYGTGMEGGSSGGAHIANMGELSVFSAGSPGAWPFRNVVFAVTSWGYTDRTLKLGGASSLSGPGNANNFPGMFNAACTQARTLHGTGSCSLI
jgi:glutamyl endopeptidase